MDLAGTPALPGRAPYRPHTRAERPWVRLLSPAEAAAPALVEAWTALAQDAAEPNPFFEPWFLLPSLAQFAQGRRCVVLAQGEAGRLTGLMPLVWQPRYYGYPVPHVATWLHDNAFCGAPLVARGHEVAFWRAFLGLLDSASANALFAHLPELPADGPLNAALDAVLAEDGRRAVTVEQSERAMLATDLDAEAYLAHSMSAKKRKELRRQHKRLAEEGELTVERHADSAAIADWIADFLVIEAAGWKGEAGSALASAADTRAFFTEALTGAAAAGRLERLALRLDGKPVAMLASFVTPPGTFSFKTAFDEQLSRFSPGLLLQIENLALLARDDIAWADSCAVEGHSMIERLWREKRPIVSRNLAIGGPLRRAAFRALMAYETRKRSPV